MQSAVGVLVPRPTLADALVGSRRLTRQIALILGGAALMALLAQVVVPLPFTPVPITGQTYGVLLVGAILGSRRAPLSMLLYLGGGAAGLPIFAQHATPGGPTTGYLIGFVVAAAIVGRLAERGFDRRVWTAAIAMLAGEVAIYAVALPFLGPFVGFGNVVALGLVPFIPGDLIKLALAAATLPLAWRFVPHDDA